jgi:hypothetical protein
MDDIQQQQYQSMHTQLSNLGYNAAASLQIRLDTDTVKNNLAPFFRGAKYTTVMNKDGKPENIVVWEGLPLCNDQGYQAILTWLNVVVNPQVIQGNMEDRDFFGEYMMNLHKDITEDLMLNRNSYGIPLRQVAKIIHNLTDLAYPILTRTLYDKERLGMNNTTKIQESMTSQPSGGFSIPFFGGGKK